MAFFDGLGASVQGGPGWSGSVRHATRHRERDLGLREALVLWVRVVRVRWVNFPYPLVKKKYFLGGGQTDLGHPDTWTVLTPIYTSLYYIIIKNINNNSRNKQFKKRGK